MRVLLSTIGSRGDVEPLLALGLALTALDHEVRVCAPPDFRDWLESFGIAAVPIGPELRSLTATRAPALARLSPEQLRRLATDSVDTQFATITAAAEGCDMVVAGGALQIASRSVAEALQLPYVYASYCPITMPSEQHAPPPLGLHGDSPRRETAGYRALWAQDAQRWNDTFGVALNAHRAAAGLPPVSDVRSHIFSEQPLLAADPTLAPWPEPTDGRVLQTGAWLRRDERPLPRELERFLEAGDSPIYFGLGSMHAPEDLSRVMIESARALGSRAIVSRGWAELSLIDDRPDCISVGEVNQQALFRRVAAVVHHGGAGTTTSATHAGAAQVVLPQMYDQHYFARRVEQLGIGSTHEPAAPTTDSLISALSRALQPDVAARARALTTALRTDGAMRAAQHLLAAQPAR